MGCVDPSSPKTRRRFSTPDYLILGKESKPGLYMVAMTCPNGFFNDCLQPVLGTERCFSRQIQADPLPACTVLPHPLACLRFQFTNKQQMKLHGTAQWVWRLRTLPTFWSTGLDLALSHAIKFNIHSPYCFLTFLYKFKYLTKKAFSFKHKFE